MVMPGAALYPTHTPSHVRQAAHLEVRRTEDLHSDCGKVSEARRAVANEALAAALFRGAAGSCCVILFVG